MMRELDTVSPVVWPAWCYSGEGQGDLETIPGGTELNQSAAVESPKSRGKRRGGGALKENRTAMNGSTDVHNNNNSNNNNNKNPPVKTERLSPATTDSPSAPGATMTATPDNNSSSSRSATPSSSYPGTPPTTERVGSPSGHIKHMEQMMTRNYSDFMRSLAAKYNNNNPNDYFSSPTRNGFGVGFDPRFSSFKSASAPFLGLVAPTAAQYKTAQNSSPSPAGSSKDDAKKDLSLYAAAANFGAGTFGTAAAAGSATTPMFPPLIDMSSTQALLNMARTASAHNASQLEIYLKGAIKRPPPSESSPLDLSSASLPSYGKKSRGNKSVSDSIFLNSDSLLHVPIVDTLRNTKDKIGKRTGSVSPKPPPPATSRNSGASSAGSSPRLQPSSTMTSSTGRHLPCLSMCTADRGCGGPESQAMAQWTVDDVCNFVTSIDVCAEYAPNFREQRIDGSSLPLLTEEHLTTTMGMKLGPALKLRATLARRLGHCAICLHCVHCHNVPTPSSPAQTPPAVIGRPSSAGN